MSILKNYFFIIAILFHQHSYGQKKSSGNIFFEPGIAYRQGLLELKNYPVRSGRRQDDMGYQFGGISMLSNVFMLNLVGGYSFNDKNRIQLSNYLYKNYLVTLADSINILTEKLYSYKTDIFIDYVHTFIPRKKKKLFFEMGAGIGLMNLSKSFTYIDYEYVYDENNNYVKIKRKLTENAFTFFAPRIIIGLKYKHIQFQLINHITPDDDLNNKISFWIEGRLLYHIKVPKRNKLHS